MDSGDVLGITCGMSPLVPREGEVNTWDEIYRNLQGRLFHGGAASLMTPSFTWLRHYSDYSLMFHYPQQQERSQILNFF